jgi:hypothetical protein
MTLPLPPDAVGKNIKVMPFKEREKETFPDDPALDDVPPRGASQPQEAEGVSVDDFYAFMPMHSYIFVPTREMWPASSVNARIPPIAVVDDDGEPVLDNKGEQKVIPASAWLDRNKPVEQMTCARVCRC